MSNQWPPSSVLPYVDVEPEASTAGEPWGYIEFFVAIQLLWGVFLFLPGMQPFRLYIRALPYVSSLAALAYFATRASDGAPWPAPAKWLAAVFAVLGLNMLHAETHLMAGLGQVVFQLAIAAPMFWVAGTVRSEARMQRLLWIMFVASFAGAALGVLQVYFPDRFLPPEFSALARSLNPEYVSALTYTGADGRLIVRPSGLSDLPGGAAISGLTTMVLGVVLTAYGSVSTVRRACYLGAAGLGMTALYLTQVRSLTIVAPAAVLLFAAVRLRQGRWAEGTWITAGAAALVVGSFIWAITLGGESLTDRFASLFESGLMTTFQENRGLFLEYTVSDLLYQFPFGAGLGRWGMMQVYFGDASMWQAPPIYVEIQPTGWLLDGGVPMWLCYGGALVAAMHFAYRTAVNGANEGLQHLGSVVLAGQAMIAVLCLTGPVFNTQLGIQFWTLTAALAGVVKATDDAEAAFERGEGGTAFEDDEGDFQKDDEDGHAGTTAYATGGPVGHA